MDWLQELRDRRKGMLAGLPAKATLVARDCERASLARAEKAVENQGDDAMRIALVGPLHWLFGADCLWFAELLLAQSPERVEVHIDSPGGSVFEALALRAALDTLRTRGSTVHTAAGGMVASAATLIFLAGTERTQYSYTRTLIHDVRGWLEVYGTESTITEHYESFMGALAAARESLRALYLSAMPSAPIDDWLSGEDVWLTADQALAFGFATDTVEAETEDEDEQGEEAELTPSIVNAWMDNFRNTLRITM